MEEVKERKAGRLWVLLLFIFILSILFGVTLWVSQNTFTEPVSELEGPIQIDQILFKALLKQGESFSSTLSVTNNDNRQQAVTVASSLSQIVSLSQNNFLLASGQRMAADVTFNALNQNEGVYVGVISASTGTYSTDSPLIVEIESQDVDYDLNVNMPRDSVIPGSEISAEVRVFNLANLGTRDVEIEYFIKGIDGTNLVSERETVSIDSQASIAKAFPIPYNFKPGTYVFGAEVRNEDSVGTATEVFEVRTAPEPGPVVFLGLCSTADPICWLSLFILIVLLFTILSFVYYFIAYYFVELFRANKEVRKKQAEIYAQEQAIALKYAEQDLVKEAKKLKKLPPLKFVPKPKKKGVVKEWAKDVFVDYKTKGEKELQRRDVARVSGAQEKLEKLRTEIILPKKKFGKKSEKSMLNVLESTAPKPGEGKLPKLVAPIPVPTVPELEPLKFEDPWQRIKLLEQKCSKNIKLKNVDFAEMAYLEMKPQFRKLDQNQKQAIYPILVDLQNNIVTLKMKKMRKELMPHKRRKSHKKKTRQKKTKKKTHKKKTKKKKRK